MKTQKQIQKRIEFIESVLDYGDAFLPIKVTPNTKKKFYIELRILNWVLNKEPSEKEAKEKK